MSQFVSTRTKHGSTITQFPGNCFEVTPDDEVEYPDGITIFVADAGNVVVRPAQSGDDPITLSDVPTYQIIPFRVSKVYASTTAKVFAIY